MSTELTLREPPAIATDASLEQLAEIANSEHELTQAAVANALLHALRAGDALCVARSRVPHGQWLRWLEVEFDGRGATARLYMRLARRRELLLEAGCVTINSANRYLAMATIPRGEEQREASEARQREIRAMRKAGMSVRDIAGRLDVTRATVYYWLRPGRTRKLNALKAERRRVRKAVLKQQERDRLARAAGGDVGKAYSQIRLLARTLENAAASETNGEARAALRIALSRLYRVEDKIVCAIGVAQ